MEANRDSALHYIELAEKCISAGDNERAIRFLNKSENLYPTPKARDLLERLMYTNSQSMPNNENHPPPSSASNQNHATTNGSSSTRQRTTSAGHSASASNDYTQEEADAVRKIRSCKDLYEILGVTKTATEGDLKKAYRKLALQYHPDKCKAPGATDAFKAIGKAFSILSDPKKREQYDMYGQAMEPQHSQHRGSHRGGGQAYYYEDDDDFSAEELFNMFFGYTGSSARVYRRRTQPSAFHFTTHSNHNNQQQTTTHTVYQLLPYLFLFLVSILGTLFVPDAQFQLHRSNKYPTLRQTRTTPSVSYYVRADFRVPKTANEVKKLDQLVIDEYVNDLRTQCYREQQLKESNIWRARMLNDNELYQRAQRQGTPSCTKLDQFAAMAR